MDTNEKVAFINSQVACALITLEAYKATNKEREMNGYSLAYSEEAILDLINIYGIDSNTVFNYLNN